jgi:hypothetical protein
MYLGNEKSASLDYPDKTSCMSEHDLWDMFLDEAMHIYDDLEQARNIAKEALHDFLNQYNPKNTIKCP